MFKYYESKEDVIKITEEKLNYFAQKNDYAKRLNDKVGKINLNRTEFQRDKDRILHCKYFRRLMHKTQIFADTDEYYRTRLTHTLEVMQIARSLARVLGVNEDLTEAIAFGHDIGHTPFGHVGERTLHDILSGKDRLSEKLPGIDFGGFNHNFQAIRLVDWLPTYKNEPGLNLTWQVREGIWKHTKIRPKDKRVFNGKNTNCEDLLCYYPALNDEHLFKDYDFSVTIEGQIVAQADEIAQRAHDLDDGLRSGYININELVKISNQKEFAFLKDIFGFDEKDEGRVFEIDYILRQDYVTKIIRYFIKSLIDSSKENLKDYWGIEDNVKLFEESHIIIKQLIKLNDPYDKQMDILEKHITSRVVNSYEVNICDGKAIYLIKHVFKAYFTNPRQLPEKVINNIIKRIEYYKYDCVDIRIADSKAVNECITIWQGKIPDKFVLREGITKEEVEKQHGIYLRAIADHIGTMTDNQLNEAYKKLYLPS